MTGRNILIVVSDSGNFKKILPEMVEWMRALGDRINATLLGVAEFAEAATPVLEEMKLKRVLLEELASELERHGIAADIRIRTGELAKEVVEEAGRLGAFAILMTTGGRAGALRAGISTVNQVIRRAPCPVVVFKPRLLKFTDRVALTLSSRIKRLTAKPAMERS
ncbi:MAG: universal stress protein [Euryarchaeota archaeon]|nr:universal stress protein [Euryarchaeota archaeon]